MHIGKGSPVAGTIFRTLYSDYTLQSGTCCIKVANWNKPCTMWYEYLVSGYCTKRGVMPLLTVCKWSSLSSELHLVLQTICKKAAASVFLCRYLLLICCQCQRAERCLIFSGNSIFGKQQVQDQSMLPRSIQTYEGGTFSTQLLYNTLWHWKFPCIQSLKTALFVC